MIAVFVSYKRKRHTKMTCVRHHIYVAQFIFNRSDTSAAVWLYKYTHFFFGRLKLAALISKFFAVAISVGFKLCA